MRWSRTSERATVNTVHDGLTPLSESLDRVIRGLRGSDRRQVGGVFGRWEEIVGEHVANHVQPVRLESGVLVVEVTEPAWATQFEFLSGGVIERLREMVGDVVERGGFRVARRPRRPDDQA